MKTKVCHVTSVHKSMDDRIFLRECKSLAEAGFEVFLVAPNCEAGNFDNVTIINVESDQEGRLKRMLNTTRKVYEAAFALNCDVYHFHDPEMLPFANKMKKKGKKVIYDTHEDVPRQIMGKYWIPTFLRKFIANTFERYENKVARKLDRVVTATKTITERFLTVNPQSYTINNYPLLSEMSTVSHDWDSKGKVICFTGGISRIRGLSEILKSIESLDVRFLLAGGFSPEEFQTELEKEKGWEKVENKGFVSREEVKNIFEQSMLGIVTYLPLPNHVDAQPAKLFEYMAAGLPMVASNFPLWHEIVEQNGCGVCADPTNPEELTKAIEHLLSNPAVAKKMGENGRKAVLEKYSWEAESKKLVELYKSLV
jgi:hypothetical protein